MSDLTDSAEVQAHVHIHGRVQGVYFRGRLREQAQMRGVQGWVRNMPDGSVEALLQGPKDHVDAVVAWAHHGPRGAIVESVKVNWEPLERKLPTFEIRG